MSPFIEYAALDQVVRRKLVVAMAAGVVIGASFVALFELLVG